MQYLLLEWSSIIVYYIRYSSIIILKMLKGLNSRTIKTQPQHQTIASYSSRADRQSAQTNSQSDLH